MMSATLITFWAVAAAALSPEDKAWMMKVDYRNIKAATDRCKTIRRSCLAFAEEPIPAKDWAWILKGLSPEERELMRRRYSISPEAMTAANGQAVRSARPRGEEYRDAVGSTPDNFAASASGRIHRLAGGGAPPAVQAGGEVRAAARVLGQPGPPPTPRARPARRAVPPPPPAARPADAPAATEDIQPGRLARMNAPFLAAATSGRFSAGTLEPALRWGKENPPLNDAERALRERLRVLKPMIGSSLSESQKTTVKSVMREAGLTLTPAQEANLLQAVENGLSWGDMWKLRRYR